MSAALKAAERWAHPGGFYMYVAFLYSFKSHHWAGTSTASDYSPPVSDDLQESSFFFFTISPLALQSPSNWWCPSDYKQLGKDILRCWCQGEEGKKWENRKSDEEDDNVYTPSPAPLLPPALQSLHCTCATSNISQSEEGFSMWLAVFFKPSRVVIIRLQQQASNVVDLS